MQLPLTSPTRWASHFIRLRHRRAVAQESIQSARRRKRDRHVHITDITNTGSSARTVTGRRAGARIPGRIRDRRQRRHRTILNPFAGNSSPTGAAVSCPCHGGAGGDSSAQQHRPRSLRIHHQRPRTLRDRPLRHRRADRANGNASSAQTATALPPSSSIRSAASRQCCYSCLKPHARRWRARGNRRLRRLPLHHSLFPLHQQSKPH